MSWLQEQLSRLITRFSIKQQLLSDGHARDVERVSFTPQYLVGRDFCQFACIDLSNVQKAKRHQALTQKIKLLSSWSDPAFAVAWKGGVAQVWFWSTSHVNSLLENQGHDVSAVLYRPEFFSEVMFWQKAHTDGLHLYKATLGVDAQYWKQGLLTASQWFPSMPSSAQLQRLARTFGLSGAVSDLTLQEPVFLEKAWDGVAFSFLDHLFDRRSQILVYATAISLLVASLQLTSVGKWSYQLVDLQAQTDELARSAEPLLTARSAARAAKQDAEEIAGLFVLPDPLSVQAAVYQAFPKPLNLELQTWERNVDQIDIGVKGDITDTLSLVRAFEQAGFNNVRVEPLPENRQYRIRLRLNTNKPIQVDEK